MPSERRTVRIPGQPTPLPSTDHVLLMREWLELLPGAVVFLSAEGRVTYANGRARELFCKPHEHLVGKTRAYCVRRKIFDAGYLEKIDRANVQTMYFIEDQEEHDIKVDKEVTRVRATYRPVVLRGTFRGVLGVFEDLTEAKEAASLRDDLMQMMFHDMKHPLAAIMLNLDGLLILGEEALSEQQQQFIYAAKQKVEQLHDMFDKMVDIGKLEQRQLQLTVTAFDMNELVEGVLTDTFALQFDAAGKRLLFAPSSKLVPVSGDVSLVQRVISNLVDNALRFTTHNGTVEVRTALGRDRRSVRVHVRDEGPGVPAQFRHIIFEKYRQVRMRKAGVEAGIGLGLAFCKLAVEAHGGTIGVKRRSSGGSDFHFTLPADLSGSS